MRRIGVLSRRPVRPAPLSGRLLARREAFLSRVAGRVAHPVLLGGTRPGSWTRAGMSYLARPAREVGEMGDLALSPRLVGRVAAAVARWLAPAGVLGRLPATAPVRRGDPSVVAARAMAFAREVASRAAPADAPRPGAAPPVRFDHPGAASGIPAAARGGEFDPAAIMRRIEAKRRGEPAPVTETPLVPRRDVVSGAALPPTVRVAEQGDVIAAAGRATSPGAPTMTYLRPESPSLRAGDGDAESPRAERARGRPLPPPSDAAESVPSPARRARTIAPGDAAAPAPFAREGSAAASGVVSVPPVTGARPVLPASEAAPIHPATGAHPLHPASEAAPVRPPRVEPAAPGMPPTPIVHLHRPAVEGDRGIAPPAASPPRAESPARETVRGEPVQPAAETVREIVREVVRAGPVVALPASPATRAMRAPAAEIEGGVVRAAPARPPAMQPAGVPASGWLAPATVMMRAVRAAERVAAATAPAAPQAMPVTARVAAPGAVRPAESAATRAAALAERIAARGVTEPHPAAARPGMRVPEGITIPGLPGPVLLHPESRRVDEAETRRVVERVLGRFEAPRSPSSESPEQGDEGDREQPRVHVGRVVGERETTPAPIEVGPSIGFALPARLREGMRALLGFDPGAARIHTGDAAARAARRLGAAAFTVGSDVFFAPGRYAPETHGGLALLAHELAHVRQQAGRPFRHGDVTPTRRAALEAEARASEARVHAPRPEASSTRAWAPVAVSFAPLAAPAAPMLAAEESAPASEPAQAGQPAATAAAQGAHPAGAPQTAGANAEAIAEEVYRLIRDRMRIERERRGIQPWA
ncbi:MAG TPA: DUF4157 domain-containing protein [Longimicrobium sp.]